MFDGWRWCGAVEVARCGAFLAYAAAVPVVGVPIMDHLLTSLFVASAVLCIFHTTLEGEWLKLLRAL